ncbi:MAG TPA: hypothetical protein VHE80_08275, partial [Acidimicrobiales bacterium]|nr:hypothetical protein [Acidimicrobiales bacterium]
MRSHDRRRSWLFFGAALVAAGVAAACSSGSSEGPQTRTVQVDYRHDEFAGSLFDYFPRRVEVRPGDTVEFKQAWTGEPHSVTMGTLVDEKIRPIVSLVENVRRTGEVPGEEPAEFHRFGEALPFAFDDEGDMAQNAAQPCYVDAAEFTGTYPGDADTPCPRKPQPAFNGRQAIYNSGVIPYEGVNGNTFTVQLADDIAPGTYNYYCNVHGALQYGQLVVREKGAPLPSKSAVARQAREQAEEISAPMLRRVRAAREGRVVEGGDQAPIRVDAGRARLVGVPTPFFEDGEFVHGIVNEFVPRRVEARVGQKVTWTFLSGHTLSFNVPEYFPIFTIGRDGT